MCKLFPSVTVLAKSTTSLPAKWVDKIAAEGLCKTLPKSTPTLVWQKHESLSLGKLPDLLTQH